MQNNDILKEAIAEAKTLRQLAKSSAKHSLKKFLLTESLPLNDLCNIDDLDEFIDAVLEMDRATENDTDLNPRGLPYLNNQFKKRKQNTEDDLDERSRYSDEDEFQIDYGDGTIEKSGKDDDDKEDQDNFSDEVIEERSRKWKNLHGRRNFKSTPAIVSSGVGSTKLSQNERNLLLKHAGLIKENKNICQSSAIKDNLIRQRAGIKNSNKNIAKQVVNDLEIKKKLLK